MVTFIYDEIDTSLTEIRRLWILGPPVEVVNVHIEDIGSVVPSNTRFETPTGVVEVLKQFTEEFGPDLLLPAQQFKDNCYPCPSCGQQLPQYGQGIHICPNKTNSGA